MKCVRVGGTQTRDRPARLRPGNRELRMRMCYAADIGEGPVDSDMGGKIGGRAKIAFYNFPFEIRDDHMLGLQFVIRDPAGFDDDQSLFAGNSAGVSEGIEDEPTADQFQVRLQDLLS